MIPDWLDIVLKSAAILVPSGVALWIGSAIKDRIESEKLLKNYLVNDILEIRKEYRALCDSVKSGKATPKNTKSDLSNISTHITDLMSLIHSKNETVDKGFLLPFQLELSQIITEDDNYVSNFQENKEYVVSQKAIALIATFEKKNNHLFNDLLLQVYK